MTKPSPKKQYQLNASKIAIVAGGGSSPFLIADALIARGHKVILFPIKYFADQDGVREYPHVWVGLFQFGRLLQHARKHGCFQVVYLGSVVRPKYLEVGMDWKGFWLTFSAGVKMFTNERFRASTNPFMELVSGLFAKNGLTLVDSTKLIRDYLDEDDWKSEDKTKSLTSPLFQHPRVSPPSESSTSTQAVKNPPALAEFLLVLFMPAKRREAISGDMNERYLQNLKRGRKRAALLYWGETLRSIGPKVIRLLKWIVPFIGAALYAAWRWFA